MIKNKLSIFMVLGAFSSFFASNASAFIIPLPMIPCMPTLDPVNDVVHSKQMTEALQLVKQLKETKNTIDSVIKAKGFGDIYKGNFCFLKCDKGSDANKELVNASKEVVEAKTVDINDFESVKKGFYKNFLVLPSDDFNDEDCFRNIGRKLGKDTAIETYTVAIESEEEIKELYKKLAAIEEAAQKGTQATAADAGGDKADKSDPSEGGVEMDAAENNNAALENTYQAYVVYEHAMRRLQILKAIQMQYEGSVAVLDKTSPIRSHEAEKIKTKGLNFNTSSNLIYNSGKKYVQNVKLSFAQSSDDYNFLGLVKAPDAGISSPLSGNEENFAALNQVSEMGDKVYEALDIHSLIAALDEYRNIFVTYEKFEKLHNHSVNMLKISEQCSVNYLSKYYKSPNEVWSGGEMGNLINQHEFRKGVSKRLIDAYDVAKAQMLNPMEPEELKVMPLDANTDIKNTPSLSSAKSKSNVDKEEFNPVKEKKSNEIGRTNYLMPWNLGAEISLDLGKDQQAENKWGELKEAYAVWNDQKNYYDQYVEYKYDNISKYLQKIDLRPSEIDISRALNKENKNNVVNKYENMVKEEHAEWITDLAKFENGISLKENGLPRMPSPTQKLSLKDLNELNSKLLKRKSELSKMDNKDPKVAQELDMINKDLSDISKKRDWFVELSGFEAKANAHNVNTGNELMIPFNKKAYGVILNKQSLDRQEVKLLNKINALTSAEEVTPKMYNEIAQAEEAVKKIRENKAWLDEVSGLEASYKYSKAALPESEWIEDVNKKMQGMIGNDIYLNKKADELRFKKESLEKQINFLNTRAKKSPSNTLTNQIIALQKAVKEINDKLGIILSNKTWLKQYYADLLGIVKVEDWTVDTTAGLALAKIDEQKQIDELENEFNAIFNKYSNTIVKAISERDKEIKAYEKRLDVISVAIDEAENKVNLYTKTLNRAEEDVLATKHDLPKVVSGISVNKPSLKAKVVDQNNVIKKLSAEARTIIAKIDERMKYYDGKIANAEREFTTNSRELYDHVPTFDDMTPLLHIYTTKVVKDVEPVYSRYVPFLANYLKIGVNVSEEFRPYAVKEAEKTRDDIFALKDALYLQSSNAAVNGRHKEFIEELKDINVEDLLVFAPKLKTIYTGPVAVIDIVKALYTKYVVETLCPDDACYANDEVYFVALVNKERDFQAPKEPITEYLPPVREVFFFDDVNYASFYSDKNAIKIIDSEPHKVGNITIGTYKYHYIHYLSKYGLANYGGRVPEVWKLVLSSRAFVERDIDLKRFFGEEGDENEKAKVTLLRGGRYPCKLNDLTIDIDKNANFIVTKSEFKRLPICREIKIANRLGYYVITDVGSDDKASVGGGLSISENYKSELGQLFYYKDDYMFYRSVTEKAYDRVAEVKKLQEQGRDYNSNIKDTIYDNAVFKKNQFGDFIEYVELERTYRKSKDKIKVSLDEAKEELFAQLNKVGYSPNEDLNLARDSDYNSVKSALRSRKHSLLKDVEPLAKEIKKNANHIVMERFDNFNAVYKALEMDSEALVAIPSTDPDLTEISEAIKSERANRKAKGAYDKETNDAIEKELKKISAPYCASYQ